MTTPAPNGQPAPIEDDDDVILIDDDGEPAEPTTPQGIPQGTAPAPAQAAQPAAGAVDPVATPFNQASEPAAPATPTATPTATEPAAAPAEPAVPAEPPSLDDLAAATNHQVDIAAAMSQVASATPAQSASAVLRRSARPAEASALKKNAVPFLFTIGSICFAIGGWALLHKLGVFKFEGADDDAIKNHDMKVLIGMLSIPVGLLLILASIYMGVQVYGAKPDSAK